MNATAWTVVSLFFLIVAPYLLYPVLLWIRALLVNNPPCAADVTPRVDLVICAHNEEQVIAQKVHNTLALEYPAERLTIWIASDGSDDRTVTIARQAGGDRVRVLDLPRAGKAAALNACVASGNAEVVAFSDANSMWAPDALRQLTRPFADPRVGGVAGDQRYVGHVTRAQGERGYWDYDRMLKRWQTNAGNVISATGAIYAVRRDLFQSVPPDATDDFMISTGVIAAGKRLVFAENAVASEAPATDDGEYRRKVRILTRGLRAVYYRRALLLPWRSGFYSIQLLLHKLLRRLVWIPLLLLCPALWFALDEAVAIPLLLAASSAVAIGAAGLASSRLRRFRLVDIFAYIVMVNCACMAATFNALRGRSVTHWSPTAAIAGFDR